MVCQKCYAQIPDNSSFCPMCGQNPQNTQSNTNSGYSQNQQYGYQAQPQPQPQPQQPTYYQQPASASTDVSLGEWIWSLIVLALPLVGFVLSIVWAFSKSTPVSKSNYCKAVLIFKIVALLFVIIGVIISVTVGVSLLDEITDFFYYF